MSFNFKKEWLSFVNQKKELFDDFFFNNYLQNCFFLEIKNKTVIIVVPSRFVKRIFLEKQLDQSFNKIYSPYKINFVIEKKWLESQSTSPNQEKKTDINNKFTFENLVIGDFNNGVINGIKEILLNKKTWNPLFIHSEPGLGKTHILKAMVNESKKEEYKKKVIYLHANSFSNQVLKAFNEKEAKIQTLKENIVDHQIILFDDVQLFTGRKKINEVLFQILYDAVEKKREIIFSSDQHPEELSGFEKRLRSRFAQGLVLKIDYPDLKTAELITQKKVIEFIPDISKIDLETISFIAQTFRQDIRKIEGVIKKIAFNINLNPDQEITLKEFKYIFREQKFVFEKKISTKKIKKIVAKFYGVDYNAMHSKIRKKETVKARSVAMYLIRKLTNENFASIATGFNAKNHTTAVNAIKKISKLLKKTSEYQTEIKRLTEICQEI